MALPSTRWHVVTESSYPWKQDALDFVRELLPDQQVDAADELEVRPDVVLLLAGMPPMLQQGP
jgi:hypothetical protein